MASENLEFELGQESSVKRIRIRDLPMTTYVTLGN